ncbi:MAG: hypothetical protein U5J96_14780 [Ignavibacteriaceae bacterium]|nr:hypothetical protein [Ignavibacteriaceae bacterium]
MLKKQGSLIYKYFGEKEGLPRLKLFQEKNKELPKGRKKKNKKIKGVLQIKNTYKKVELF